MKKILVENYITSYDDMIYESGPNKFNNFISDKYNKVHIELYNDALQKFYVYLLDTNISYEFLYELFLVMKNNSDSPIDLYNAIMKLDNDNILKKALTILCSNSKSFVSKLYNIVFKYLNELKQIMVNNIKDINNVDEIEDFTASYIDTSTFIKPENEEETFDYLFKTYNLDSVTNELEIHNFYMSEMMDYVFILEHESGLKIGFNRKGEWIIVIGNYEYESENLMIKTFNSLKEINNNLKNEIRLEISKNFKLYHKVIEIKNTEYWMPSSVMIISKISPYRKQYVNLSPWWNNIHNSNNKTITDLKITNENILDSEVIDINYVSGKVKMYSKNADLTYEVPFDYMNNDTELGDEVVLTNTFRGNL